MRKILISLLAGLAFGQFMAAQPQESLHAARTGLHTEAPDKNEAQRMEGDKDYNFGMGNYYNYWNQARNCPEPEKEAAFAGLRQHFQKHPWRIKWEKDAIRTPQRLLELMTERGTFSDMDPLENKWRDRDLYNSTYSNTPDDKVGIFIAHALQRVFLITEAYRKGELEGQVPLKVWKSIRHYAEIELHRSNLKPRFHASCFAIPAAASNIYFSLLDEMDAAEQGPAYAPKGSREELRSDSCRYLKALALQSWTQPMRRDETDRNVVSLARFRNHVWWVGGNALAYRPLLPAAVMFSSVPMVDVLAEVGQRCISSTSQATYEEAFWTEGFTADGAGWGHGMQCLIWGYPIDGTSNALGLLQTLNGTPWEQHLTAENTEALMNFFRGGAWYWYKGWRLPGLDRNSYRAELEPYAIAYEKMLDKVLSQWGRSFSPEDLAELKQLSKECKKKDIRMEETGPGMYHGSRWFFNNDDFMVKNGNRHVSLNMASFRCDGLESAPQADNYNFTCTDGATLFQRDGDEYFKIMGGWDVTAYPGVTAREGMEKLTPVTNWRGYCSRYNFAGAAHDRQGCGAAGLIFDKIDANLKKDAHAQDGKTTDKAPNKVLYGVTAYKSWFFIGDYMLALGAGITDRQPELAGNIRTTIDQTALEGKVWMTRGKKREELVGTTALPAAKNGVPVWISQEGKFSYCLWPEYRQEVSVTLESRKAEWVKMNRANKAQLDQLPEKVSVFQISINHGQRPVEDKYAYVVWLGGDNIPKEARKKLPFELLRNDKKIQAVQTADGKILQAVFYPEDSKSVEQQTFYGGHSKLAAKAPANIPTAALETGKINIRVSAPCVLMLDRRQKMLYVTDATMNAALQEIKVWIDGKEYRVPLPQGKRLGDCASISLQ